MKTALSATALVLSLVLGATAHADSRDHNRQHGHNEQHQRHDHDSGHTHTRVHGGSARSGHSNDRARVYRAGSRQNWQARNYEHRQYDHDRWHRDYRAYDFRPTHRFHSTPYYRPYGYAPRVWRHGDYLPRAYYAPRYILDYHVYGLRRPPHGYHWVRVEGDVMLAAITTGLIVGAVYDVF